MEHLLARLEDRADYVDWWLVATAIFLTLLGVIVPLLSYRGFQRFDQIEADARRYLKSVQEHAEKAEATLKTLDDRAKQIVEGTRLADRRMRIMTAESTVEDPKGAESASAIMRKSGLSVAGLTISEAIAAQQSKDYRSALAKWHQVAFVSEENDPEQAARAWFSVGFLIEIQVHAVDADRDTLERAIGAYDSAIRLHPEYSEAYFNRGNLRCRLSEYEPAALDYTSSARILPKPRVYYNRGNAYFRCQRFPEAVADYDTALSLLHQHPDVAVMHLLHNKGNALLAEGKLQKAQECLRGAGSLGELPENTRLNLDFIDAIREIDGRPIIDTDSAVKKNGRLCIFMQLDASVEDLEPLKSVPHKDNFGNVGSMGSREMKGGPGGKGGAGFEIALQAVRGSRVRP